MITLSRRTTLASAAMLVSALGASVAVVAPAGAAAAAPTVTAGTPLGAGAVDWPLTVTGTGLTSDTKVTFTSTTEALPALGAGSANTDVVQDTAKSATVNAAGTSLTVLVNVSPSAAAEKLDIIVTNGNGKGTCYAAALTDPGCQMVDAAPTKLTFTSNVGVGAFSHATSFTATGLQPGTGQLLSAVPGTSPAEFTSAPFALAAGATGANPNITVPTATAAGTGKNVTLINGDGGRETAAALTITAPPFVSALSPKVGDAGTSVTLTATSSNKTFETTPAPQVGFLGKIYTATNPTSSSFTVTVAIPATTPASLPPITVLNGDGGSDTEQNLFTVIGAPGAPPVVTSSMIGNGTATVLWQQVDPSNDGGAPVVSYTVTTTPDTGAHVVLASAPPAFTLTGLTNGTAYTATVSATNSDTTTNPQMPVQQTGPGTMSPPFTPVGPGAPGSPGAPGTTLPGAAAVPAVTLKASKTTIAFASPVTISGKVLLSGAPLAHTVISLQSTSTKGVRTDTGMTTTTGADGSFTFKAIKPVYTATYGLGIGSAAPAAGVKVTVTQYLVLLSKTLGKTRRYVVTGLGTPGTSDKKATVVLFKVTKTGHRVGTLTRTLLAKGKTTRGYSSGTSAFTLATTLRRGTYRVAVAILGTSTNGPVQSKPFTITVP